MKDPRRYYDDFSHTYDDVREHGYHAVIDDLEADLVRCRLRGERVLEVGCGTGQLLRRVSGFAPRAVGIDLSRGMLARARARGFRVAQASATALPFRDRSFDLVYSFKVLPHVPDLPGALAEIARVLDEGGVALLEFYNRRSLRGIWKRLRWWSVQVGRASHDREVFTAYHTPEAVQRLLPSSLTRLSEHGVVVATPHPAAHRVPGIAPVLRALERALRDGPLARLGGFYVVAAAKRGATIGEQGR